MAGVTMSGVKMSGVTIFSSIFKIPLRFLPDVKERRDILRANLPVVAPNLPVVAPEFYSPLLLWPDSKMLTVVKVGSLLDISASASTLVS